MQRVVVSVFWRAARVLSLTILAVLGTIGFMRIAPGYFSDEREMDAEHGAGTRAEVAERYLNEKSLASTVRGISADWSNGTLGVSRQYAVPVAELVRERIAVTGKLLLKSLILGWVASLGAAVVLGARKRRAGESLVTLASTGLLCVPIAVMATACLMANWGGSVFVLAAIVAIREFKLIYRLLRQERRAPYLLFARSQGTAFSRILFVHLLRRLRWELLALLMSSFVVGLSAAVPVEVIFDRPGLGQLAWSAAMNRDLPVLVAVTVLMAGLVGLASMFTDSRVSQEASACA